MQYLTYLKHSKKLLFKNNALPEQVTFFVTPKCNARCKHCFAWQSLNDTTKAELSLEEIEKISKTMGHFTYLLLGGGEPFIREDLAEIVKIFYRNNNVLNVSISTNGFFTERTATLVKEVLKDFKNSLTINVSLDEVGDDHDEFRQLPGLFKKATDTYRLLKELKKEYPKLNAGIIMTCTPFNQERLNRTYNWLKENLKPYSVVLNYMRGEIKGKEELPETDLSAYEDIMRIIEKDNLSGQLPGHGNFCFSNFNIASKILMRKMISNTVRTNTFQAPCFAGILNCVLWYNGDLYPCEMLDMKIGSLRQNGYDFMKAWNSNEAKKIRRFIKETKCFCTEECNINMNILFNMQFLPKLLGGVAKVRANRLLKKVKRWQR